MVHSPRGRQDSDLAVLVGRDKMDPQIATALQHGGTVLSRTVFNLQWSMANCQLSIFISLVA
jgi:hypothetical protein